MKRVVTIALATLIGIAGTASALHAGDAKTPLAVTPSQLKWVAEPTAPGVMTAVVWGDPAKGPHGVFHKFTPGFTAPLHTHSANTKIVVLAGTMVMAGADGKEMKFPAGSYYEQPNTYQHVTRCEMGAECLLFLTADAKWDLKPVEPKK